MRKIRYAVAMSLDGYAGEASNAANVSIKMRIINPHVNSMSFK